MEDDDDNHEDDNHDDDDDDDDNHDDHDDDHDHFDNQMFLHADVGEVPKDGRGPAKAKQVLGVTSWRPKVEGLCQCPQF